MKFLVLAWLLLFAMGCRGDLVNRRTHAMIARELETARLSGFRARFATATTVAEDERLAAEPRPDDVTVLVLYREEGHLYPARTLTAVLGDDATKQAVHDMVSPYLAYDDPDGAARALVRVYSEALRRRGVYRPTRSLAPLMPPEPHRFRPLETAHWGVFVALLTALLYVSVMSRREHAEK